MTDKQQEYLNDVTSINVSNCCNAKAYELGDQAYCRKCGEPCEAVAEEE